MIISSDLKQDISINILIDYDDDFRLRKMFKLQQIKIE